MTVIVCELRDRECGDYPAGWCNTCQKRPRPPLDIDDVRDLLKEMGRASTSAAVSKKLGVSAQYLCDIQMGRRAPGPKVLRAIGLREVITYERITS